MKKANDSDIEVLALVGRKTWEESHGIYIENKNSLEKYLNNNFSIVKTTEEINNPKNIFYVVYVNKIPVGYAKIVLNEKQEKITSNNICRLERIFILNEFIPLKIGKQLLSFVEKEARAFQLDTMWLTVYIKNKRAIRFYEKNEFKNVGNINFLVDEKIYDNIIFSKNL